MIVSGNKAQASEILKCSLCNLWTSQAALVVPVDSRSNGGLDNKVGEGVEKWRRRSWGGGWAWRVQGHILEGVDWVRGWEKERNQGWSLGLSGTECCHLTSRLPSKKGTNECMAAQRVFHKRAGVCFPERARGWAGPIAEGLRGATFPAQSCRDFPERLRVKVSEPAPERLGEVQPHGTTSGLCPQLLPVPALGATMLCGLGGQARLRSPS